MEQEEKWFQAVKVGNAVMQVSTANEPWPAAPLTTILHHQPLSRTCSSQRASGTVATGVDSGQLGSPEFSFPYWPGRRWISFPLKYFTQMTVMRHPMR